MASHSVVGAMPPNLETIVEGFEVFDLPNRVENGHASLAKAIISTLCKDGILIVRVTPSEIERLGCMFTASKEFFQLPDGEKKKCVNSQCYSGYFEIGEEVTGGTKDNTEVFTITRDVSEDCHETNRLPCHGPCPWPKELGAFQGTMEESMSTFGNIGFKIIKLIELGLVLETGPLTRLTEDGWHHMRLLRYPPVSQALNESKGRGVGSHTDYGLLVIISQDQVGGLLVQRPIDREKKPREERWTYVPPVKETVVVILGDMMQLVTNEMLMSTIHRVDLKLEERFSFAYFHEPSFTATCKPLPECGGKEDAKGVRYGAHFTEMFMRNYPGRETTRKLREILASNDL